MSSNDYNNSSPATPLELQAALNSIKERRLEFGLDATAGSWSLDTEKAGLPDNTDQDSFVLINYNEWTDIPDSDSSYNPSDDDKEEEKRSDVEEKVDEGDDITANDGQDQDIGQGGMSTERGEESGSVTNEQL